METDGAEEDVTAGGSIVGFWTQTRLLIEKNWKCKLRSDKKKLAGEIFLPVLYLFILSFLVKSQPNTQFPAQTNPDSDPTNILEGLLQIASKDRLIAIVPNTTDARNIAKMMNDTWNEKRSPTETIGLRFAYYSSVDEVEIAHASDDQGVDLAIVFYNIDPGKIYNYTIMTGSSPGISPPGTYEKLTGLKTCRSNREGAKTLESPATCPVNGYYYSGFLALQYLLDQSLLRLVGSDFDIPDITMQNFPKLEYKEGMSTVLRAIIPLYSVIPMAQLINNLLVLIVTEKEDRIKDGFRMIGISDSAYWLSWFTVYSVIIGILSVVFTTVMHLTNVLRNINVLLLFMIFFLFGLSVITFAFALTPFFHKPKTAGIVGTLVMQFCGMLFFLQTFLESTDAYLVPLRLISSLAFTTAIDEACAHEYNGGVTFSDLLPNRRGARILYSLIFICFDIVFYGIIAVYLDNVIPNEYGARRHPLFCFSSSFWCGKRNMGYKRSSFSDDDQQDNQHNPNVEGIPQGLVGKEAIKIRNVYKTYTSLFGSTKVEAIKGISLDIYDGQITAILGKNGAGKSTLFSIITGLVPPTSGRSIVFGMDTSNPVDLDRLRKITGVCLQSDLHFAPLTVGEHLEFYGRMRGLQGDNLKQEVSNILEELQLTDKETTRAQFLSGGQKRKLSVAIALVGDPKIILLDEPSAGVDPVSRRHLWSLLKRKREGRVILLTTHFLDEADFLADRKAIIHNGVLKCHGSSLFLKNRYGVGYHLTIETEGRFDSERCDELIKSWAPAALKSKKIIGKEIKYCLPHSDVHKFADLFKSLEDVIAEENSPFKSYGVSMTTLEEVFLKISNDAWVEDHSLQPGSENANTSAVNDNPIDEECNLIPDVSDITIQRTASLWALCLLRIRRLIRSPQSLFFLLLMPSIFVSIGLVLMKTQSLDINRELLSLDNPKSIYSGANELRVAISGNETERQDFMNFLKNKEFETLVYSGTYSDLLQPSFADPGTLGAVSILGPINFRINGTFLHSPPVLLNMLSQYYWNRSQHNASFYANIRSFAAKKSVFDASTFYAVFLIGPTFAFPAVGMVMELVKDREISARNHLRVNGVSFSLYFTSIFIVFGALSTIVTLIQIGLIYLFALPAFMTPYAMIVTTVLLLLFIPSCLLFSTIFSYLFDRMESAQSIFSPISSWMGTLVGIAMILIDGLLGSEGSNTSLIAHGFFSALDVFYIPFGVFYWINKQYILCSILGNCEDLRFSDYLGPEILIMAICLLVQIPIFTLLVIVADVLKNEGSVTAALASIFKSASSSSNRVRNVEDNQSGDISDETMEEDVLKEKNRVARIFADLDECEKSVVAAENLKKTYQPQKSMKDRCLNKSVEGQKALKGINFAVEEGEVFGLLGHNGAGKSTALRILTAEESSDSGRVRLCGVDIRSNYSEAFLKLGYCAQHDPLWENITLKEHLELYAVIRGIPKGLRERLIDHFLTGLQIEEHSNKKAAQLSGGTKRKLSYGISMLGAPKIVLLDEPSTGMDPQSKRFLWNTVLGSFKDSRGAILTTHSMEEAEILSTRIAILRKGSLICIGSPQHLKSKYGTGYTLEIKLKSGHSTGTNDEERYAFVQQHFPDCKVNEVFDDKAVFTLPSASVQSISQTFSKLEQLKQEFDIEEYAFSQITLEQVFLLFAKEQDEDDTADIST